LELEKKEKKKNKKHLNSSLKKLNVSYTKIYSTALLELKSIENTH
jgi:hypothetical protein